MVEVNDARKKRMAQKIIDACGGSVAGKTIAVLGLTFKPNTDDMRDAPSLDIVPALQAAGATIRGLRPRRHGRGGEAAAGRRLLPTTPTRRSKGADALVILTEWNEFRGLDLERVKRLMRQPVIVDLRNIFDPRRCAAGFGYDMRRPARSRAGLTVTPCGGRSMSMTRHTSSIRRILREYDIRGIVGETLHAADARAIGRAFGTHGAARRRQDGSRWAMTAG